MFFGLFGIVFLVFFWYCFWVFLYCFLWVFGIGGFVLLEWGLALALVQSAPLRHKLESFVLRDEYLAP